MNPIFMFRKVECALNRTVHSQIADDAQKSCSVSHRDIGAEGLELPSAVTCDTNTAISYVNQNNEEISYEHGSVLASSPCYSPLLLSV